MYMITVEEYMKINNVPKIAKKEGILFYIKQWEMNVYKLFSWDKYTYDDYYSVIGKRDRINDICNNCYVDKELLRKIKDIDSDFIKQTIEIEINILDYSSNNEDEKKKKWYAFRLLKSRYYEWSIYLKSVLVLPPKIKPLAKRVFLQENEGR